MELKKGSLKLNSKLLDKKIIISLLKYSKIEYSEEGDYIIIAKGIEIYNLSPVNRNKIQKTIVRG